jgi:hypothetical protein
MDPLIWAFVAPFVSLSAQLCGLLLGVGYLSYSHTRVRVATADKSNRIILGSLLSLLVFSILPQEVEIELFTSLSVAVPVGFILVVFFIQAIKQKRFMDYTFGLFLGWGVASCSPEFATLNSLGYRALFAAGLVSLIVLFTLVANLLDRSPKSLSEAELNLRIKMGRVGVVAISMGLIYLWAF